MSATPLPRGFAHVAVRTPTLPPATHTNAWLLGTDELLVVDPASPDPEEQARLAAELDARIADGAHLAAIVLTHHHVDHVSGTEALVAHFAERGAALPVFAHPETAARVPFPVDAALHAGDVLLAGEFAFHVHHTPGHAPGHVVLHHHDSGVIVAGDMVAGVGTILIAPDDGDLGQYLASLEAMRALGGQILLPAHGPALHGADSVLSFYIAHRHARTAQVRDALDRAGRATPDELAPVVYPELPAQAHPIAAVQILAHLRWLEAEGEVHAEPAGRWRLRGA